MGFVPCHQGGNNTRQAIDLIDVINLQDEEALLLSLDSEKAFDRLDWDFMFETLRAYGLQGAFSNAIHGLYSSASIKMPHATFQPFQIKNGTHQGCPLSPLLFVLCSMY